jgi:hypothetical protein
MYLYQIDDGTSIIRAVLSGTIMTRKDSYMIDLAAAITVFGKIELYPGTDEITIRCGGFKVEEDCTAEIYHWLKAIQERPKGSIQEQPPNMFYSLSSAPSPNRLLNSEFLQSPIRDINPQNAGYLWSPDHTFATSTPIRAVQESQVASTSSPLRQTNFIAPTTEAVMQDNLEDNLEDDELDDDEFDSFGGIDLAALEADALAKQQQDQSSATAGNKRKWTLSMD